MNDRDSGSKLQRLGYATVMKIGKSFSGIVLSSDATIMINPSDKSCALKQGISAINCSWNRLDEIPFDKMGKPRNQRILPYLLAANSVNYGKPYKMNTAEAMAASLYILGFKLDAEKLLSSFSSGEEFIRLNFDALEAYSNCRDGLEVKERSDCFIRLREDYALKKRERVIENSRLGSYLNEEDFPPVDGDEYDDTEYNDDGCQAGEGEEGG